MVLTVACKLIWKLSFLVLSLSKIGVYTATILILYMVPLRLMQARHAEMGSQENRAVLAKLQNVKPTLELTQVVRNSSIMQVIGCI